MYDDYEKTQWAIDQLRLIMPTKRWKESGDKINCRCPICGDSRKSERKARLWIYKDTASYFCFNCSSSGSLFKLIAEIRHCKISDVNRDWLLYTGKTKKTAASIQSRPQVAFKSFETPKQKLDNKFIIPETWSEINDDCKKLLVARHIFDAPFITENYKFYFDTQYNRLVIPWKTNNEITYYQSRAVYKNQEPKYMFPSGLEKPLYITQTLDNSLPYIFIFEGFLDAIFCKNSITSGGLRLSNKQKELLEQYTLDYRPVFFTDNPYKDNAAREFIYNAVKLNPKQLFFEWDKNCKSKDLNEEVCRNKNYNLCADNEYLKSHIISAAKYFVKLKMT